MVGVEDRQLSLLHYRVISLLVSVKEEKLRLEVKMMPHLSLIPNTTHPDCVSAMKCLQPR